jgi:tubulin--tyrosine ligase
MEAAVCGQKSIALSYAFFDRNHDASIISAASVHSVKLIEHLFSNWDPNTHLYSVNVPLVENVGDRKVLYTNTLQNAWTSGSCFTVIDVPADEDQTADENESKIRKAEEQQGKIELKGKKTEGTESGTDTPVSQSSQAHVRYTHQHFKWAPRFTDVYKSVEESEPGNDGWAVAQGFTSVTPLRANFMHVSGFEGEIKL